MQIYDVALTKGQVNAVKITAQGNHFKVSFFALLQLTLMA